MNIVGSKFDSLMNDAVQALGALNVLKAMLVGNSDYFESEMRAINSLMLNINDDIVSAMESNDFDQDDYMIAMEDMELDIKPKIKDIKSRVDISIKEYKTLKKIAN
jgi:hypothetical protein